MLKVLCQCGGKGGADLLGRDKVFVGGERMDARGEVSQDPDFRYCIPTVSGHWFVVV